MHKLIIAETGEEITLAQFGEMIGVTSDVSNPYAYENQPIAGTIISHPNARVSGDTAYAHLCNAALDNGGIARLGDIEVHAIMGVLRGGYSELTHNVCAFIGNECVEVNARPGNRVQIGQRMLTADDVARLTRA